MNTRPCTAPRGSGQHSAPAPVAVSMAAGAEAGGHLVHRAGDTATCTASITEDPATAAGSAGADGRHCRAGTPVALGYGANSRHVTTHPPTDRRTTP